MVGPYLTKHEALERPHYQGSGLITPSAQIPNDVLESFISESSKCAYDINGVIAVDLSESDTEGAA